MKQWPAAWRDGCVGGAAAAVLSTALLLLRSRRVTGHALAATNATSHWIWGDAAFARNDASWRHTFTGYLIHHLACTGWSVVAERWLGGTRMTPWRRGMLTAAAALVVDYSVCPRRLTPGYEARLPARDVVLSYAACGVGFAAAEALARRTYPELPREERHAQ